MTQITSIIVVALVLAGCARRDIQVSVLRSGSYTFTRHDRATIGGIANQTVLEVRQLLHALP